MGVQSSVNHSIKLYRVATSRELSVYLMMELGILLKSSVLLSMVIATVEGACTADHSSTCESDRATTTSYVITPNTHVITTDFSPDSPTASEPPYFSNDRGLLFVADAAGYIFVSEIGEALSFSSLPLTIDYPVAVDYHPTRRLVFWTDVGVDSGSIHRADLGGTNQTMLVNTSISIPDGISLDLVQDRVYWTDTGYNKIVSMNLDGSDIRVIIDDDLDKPRAIVIHPRIREMFWTDWGNVPKIEKSHLDGSSRETIVDSDVFYPNGLAFSSDGNTLYWCEAGLDRIESVDLAGGNRHLLISSSGIHPFDMAVLGDKILWTDWSHESLGYSDDGGATHSFVHDAVFSRPMGVHAYSAAMDTELLCDSTSMTLILDRSLLNINDASDVHFEDKRCIGYDHDSYHVAITTEYNQCSTTQKQTDTSIVFHNIVTYYQPRPIDGSNPVITREHRLRIPVTCNLEREQLLVGESYRPNTGEVSFEEVGYGDFTLSLERYADISFSHKANDSGLVTLDEPLFFGVNQTVVTDLTLSIDSCWATQHAYPLDGPTYHMITDGCAEDDTVAFLDFSDPTFKGFQVDAFAFIGEYEQVFVHCSILVCKNGDPDSRCSQGCLARTRRSVQPKDSKLRTISNGPLKEARR